MAGVVTELTIDGTGAERGARQYESALDSAAQAMRRSMGAISQDVTATKQSIASLGTAIGGLVSGGILATAVTMFAKLSSEIASFEQTALKAGLALREFQSLRGAASLRGVGGSEFDTGVQNLAKNLNDARRQENDLSKLLDANNIKFKERGQLTIDENKALQIAADLIRRAGTEQDKIKVADAFGVKDLLPLLRGGAEEMARLRREGEDVGSVLNSEIIQKAAEFDREWTRVIASITLRLKSFVIDGIEELKKLADPSNLIPDSLKPENVIAGAGLPMPTKEDLTDLAATADTVGLRWERMMKAIASPTETDAILLNIETIGNAWDAMFGKIDQGVVAARRLSQAFEEVAKTFKEFSTLEAAGAGMVPMPRSRPASAPSTILPVKDSGLDKEAEFLRRSNEQRESRLKMLQLEQEALGMTAQDADALKLATAELNKETERGIEHDEKRTESIKQWAREMAALRAEIDLTKAMAHGFEQASSAFITPFLRAMAQGKSAAEALRGALEGVGNQLSSMGTRMISTQLGNMFSGQAVNGAQLGAGASLALIGTAVSGIMNNFERRQQRQQNLLQSQQESRRRVQDLQAQRDLVGIDTGTLSGALQAFDIETRQGVSPMTKSAGGITIKTDEARAYEQLRDAQRLELIKKFNDAELAEEKRRQEQLESLRMDFADREFAARNDESTLTGKLAAFDRDAARQRLELAKTAAELIPNLERAQVAERLRIQRDFNEEAAAQAKQAAEEQLAASNQAARGIVQYLNSLLSGPNSSLSPTAQLQATQQAYTSQLALAKAGNVDAAGSITQFAESLRVAAQNRFGSGTGYQDILAQIRTDLLNVPQVTQSTDPVVQALASVQAAIGTSNTLLGTNNTLVTAGNTLSDQQKAALEVIKASSATTVTNTNQTANNIGDSNNEGLRNLVNLEKGFIDLMNQNTRILTEQSGALDVIVANTARTGGFRHLISGGNTLSNNWTTGENGTPTFPPKAAHALGGIAMPGQPIIFGEHHPRGPFFGTVGRDPIAITPGLPPRFAAGNDNGDLVRVVERQTQVVASLLSRIADLEAGNIEATDRNTSNRSDEAERTRRNDSFTARKRAS